jgi:hypothetical protein
MPAKGDEFSRKCRNSDEFVLFLLLHSFIKSGKTLSLPPDINILQE